MSHDTVANAMTIWVGGRCPAHAVSLHDLTTTKHKTASATMATSRGNSKVAFSNWKYRHYFSLIEIKGKNVSVTCTLCPGKKTLSTSASSNSNLMKHLTSTHANTALVAAAADPTPNAASVSSSEGDGATLLKQATLDFSGQQQMTKHKLNTLIARYVVENMLPLSTVVSELSLLKYQYEEEERGLPHAETLLLNS